MTFIIAAVCLCLVGITFVVLPWLRHSPEIESNDRQRAAVDIVRARLAELEREWRDGILDEPTYMALKIEQERRLLEDVKGLEPASPQLFSKQPLSEQSFSKQSFLKQAPSRMRWILPAVAVALPAVAVLLYMHFGNWLDWSIQQTMQRSEQLVASGNDNRGALEELAALLEKRLAQRDDDDGRRRFLLARLDMELGRPESALQQFRALVKQFPEDADLAAQLAQALYLAANRQLTPEVLQAAQRAQSLNPDQPTALGLLGIAAFESKDYVQALMNWRRLLRQLPPGSPNAQMIQRGITQAETNLGPEGMPGPKIAVSVTLAPELANLKRGTLFVFAKAVNGPPLPLAVARFDNPSLPLSVTLDDTMAMAAGMNLSSAKQVQIFARITASGQVRGEPGDLEGNSAPLQISATRLSVPINIDRRL